MLHFLGLRCDAHAQWEIRVFAEAILSLVTPIIPWTIEAWNDYHDHRGGLKLTRLEIEAIKRLSGSVGQIDSDNKREREEWAAKAARLGLTID